MKSGDLSGSHCYSNVCGAIIVLSIRGIYFHREVVGGRSADMGVDTEQLLLLAEWDRGGHSVTFHRSRGTSWDSVR